MKINPEGILPTTSHNLWGSTNNHSTHDPYDLDVKIVANNFGAKEQTGSVSCPPCNETNNTCHGTQCCSAACSGNPNCS